MSAAAGWYPDPTDPTRWAWWDGTRWYLPPPVAAPVEDPEDASWFPRLRALRWPAVGVAVAAALLIVASNLVGSAGTDATDTDLRAVIVGVGSLAFMAIGIPLIAWGCSHAFGSRRFTRDLGWRIRWIDLPLGLAGAMVMWGVSIAVALTTQAVGIPRGSNTDAIGDQMRDRPEAAFALLLVVLVTAGLLAPLSEELLFRGILFRGLVDKVPTWAAVTVQGVVFGCAHVIPSLGWANVSMLLVLSGLGVCLGFMARLTGRLASAILAHSIFNVTNVLLLYLSVQ